MAILAYVRVSTRDQNPELQLKAVTAHGFDRLYEEKVSGKDGTRKKWRELVRDAKPGDEVLFWKSDRWGRSALDVLNVVKELEQRGVTITSLTEGFDRSTPAGKLMFHILAGAAEYETEVRAERVAEGIAAMKHREATGQMIPGKQRTGRPRVIGPAEVAALRTLVESGTSVTEAAKTLKISRSTAYEALKPALAAIADGPDV